MCRPRHAFGLSRVSNMKTRFCILLFAISSWLGAQSVHLTVPAVDSSGATVTSGTAYFTWQPFMSTAGTWVPASQLTRPISGGVLDVTLAASDNYVYSVLIMSGGNASTFRWKVPAAGASSMAQLNQAPSAPALNATSIQGNAFKAGLPSASQAYLWNATTKQFELGAVSGGTGGAGSLAAANNLSDLASVSTARTNLGLGTAATQLASAFDASGAATAAVAAIPVSASGQTSPALLSVADRTSFAAKQAALPFTPENSANKGAVSGYAPLNASSVVPLANIPTIPYSQTSGVQAALGYTAQNAATANSNNAGIGNCPAGQFAVGTAAGGTQPCASVPGTGGPLKLPLNTNYALSTNNTVGGGAPFTWLFNQETFAGTVDTQSAQGYNICANGSQCVASEPAFFWGMEDKYSVSGSNYVEAYLQYQPTVQGASRPLFIQINRDNNTVTDFELNTDTGVGFHSWADNSKLWALMNPTSFSMLGSPTQTTDTAAVIRGQNGRFGSLRLDNGTTGFQVASVSDNVNIWEFDLPGQNNWIKYNNTQTVFGGSDDFTGATSTFESPAGSSRTAVIIKQSVGNLQPVLAFQNSSGVQGAAVLPSGTIQSIAYQGLGASPAVSFGTGTGSMGASSTNAAGTITSTTSGPITFTLTWASSFAYAHRAVCTFTDETTPANKIQAIQATAPTTTKLTASGATTTGDIISYSCIGY